jgi:hypothetical protein
MFSMLLLLSVCSPLCLRGNSSVTCSLRTPVLLLLRLVVLLILKLQLALWCLVVVVGPGTNHPRLDGQGLVC